MPLVKHATHYDPRECITYDNLMSSHGEGSAYPPSRGVLSSFVG